MAHDIQERYDIRRAPRGGWEVFDVATRYTIVLDGIEQTGLDVQEADAVAESLAAIARRADQCETAIPH